MRLNDYQIAADVTRKVDLNSLPYFIMGLAGEAGEVANEAKKMYRPNGCNKDRIAEELGDALWYIAMAALAIGLDLQTIAERNLAKLKERHG